MKEFLLPLLICPACLPAEHPLECVTHKLDQSRREVVSGELRCPRCRKGYPIRDGIAFLLPHPPDRSSRYDDDGMTARYLWSHYADLANDAGTAAPPYLWDDCLERDTGPSFEAGCSVGRTVFEMGRSGSLSVGCDLSAGFIGAARRLCRDGSCSVTLPLEGRLTERFAIRLPTEWKTDTVDFIVADGQALPFRSAGFRQIVSLNLLDRVPHPLGHLVEMNRVAAKQAARFLFADPFSWLTSPAPEERWIGGSALGRYPGHGIRQVARLLGGADNILTPPWEIEREGSRQWHLRTHRNHCELITSEFLLAAR